MKFSPKCRTKKLEMIYSIWGNFCSFLNWEGGDIQPKIRPRKIPFKYACSGPLHFTTADPFISVVCIWFCHGT